MWRFFVVFLAMPSILIIFSSISSQKKPENNNDQVIRSIEFPQPIEVQIVEIDEAGALKKLGGAP